MENRFMENDLTFFTDQSIGIVWVTVLSPKYKNLAKIKRKLSKLAQNNKNLALSYSGVSFGKSDLIYEIGGIGPADILNKLSILEENLIPQHETTNELFCFSNSLISYKIDTDLNKIRDEKGKITFYVFSKIKDNDISNELLEEIQNYFEDATTATFELFFSLSMHLLIKVTTNNFLETFKHLNQFREGKATELISTHTYIASEVHFTLDELKYIQSPDYLKVVETGLDLPIKAIIGIEVFEEDELGIHPSPIPVLGGFDYIHQISRNDIKSIHKEVFKILNKDQVRSTSTILGIKSELAEEEEEEYD